MNFVNNYSQPVALTLSQVSVALSLADGEYRLTVTDKLNSPTRWEIVTAVVVSGTATLTRGVEGTSAQVWPADSVIYNSITAETASMMLRGGVIEMRVEDDQIQWRSNPEADWENLISLQDISDYVTAGIDNRLLPADGTSGQSLVKSSDDDYDVKWASTVAIEAEITVGQSSDDYGYATGSFGSLTEGAFDEINGDVTGISWSYNSGASYYGAELNISMRDGEPPSDVRVTVGETVLEFSSPYYGGYGIAITQEVYDALPKSGTHPIKFEDITAP